MKKIFILSLLFLFIGIDKCYTQEVKYPSPTGYVNDFANVIPDNYESGLNQLIHELKQKTNGAEIAVVTIQSIAPLQIEDYAVRLYEKWGIGKKGVDNGVLVLLALKERRIRIEVGYGLEGALPDGKCGEIIDRFMIPYFREGKLDKGIIDGTVAIIQIIAKEYGIKIEGDKHYTHLSPKMYFLSNPLHLLFSLLLLFIVIWRISGILFFPFALVSGRRDYWYRGGNFGRGGFGGGFGGFGGGLSGGGGTTRGW